MTATDALVAFAVTAAGCYGLARVVPPAKDASYEAFLATRVARMLGRIVLVLVVIAVCVGFLGRSAPAITVGALGGWIVASLGELRRAGRKNEGRRRR